MFYCQVINQVRRRLPPGHAAMRAVPDDPSEEDEEDQEDEGYVYRLGNIPPKSHDPKRCAVYCTYTQMVLYPTGLLNFMRKKNCDIRVAF